MFERARLGLKIKYSFKSSNPLCLKSAKKCHELYEWPFESKKKLSAHLEEMCSTPHRLRTTGQVGSATNVKESNLFSFL